MLAAIRLAKQMPEKSNTLVRFHSSYFLLSAPVAASSSSSFSSCSSCLSRNYGRDISFIPIRIKATLAPHFRGATAILYGELSSICKMLLLLLLRDSKSRDIHLFVTLAFHFHDGMHLCWNVICRKRAGASFSPSLLPVTRNCETFI